jgi:ABC-type dipeptide/oligopeptide/nickel transport system permease subunit
MAVAVSADKRRKFRSDRKEDKAPTQLSIAWFHFRKQKLGMAGLITLATLVALSIVIPQFSPFDVTKNQSPLLANKPMGTMDPNGHMHLLGTETFGRDLLTFVFWALRITLSVVLPSSLAATVIGCALGMLAGYRGGWVDGVIMRLTDVMLTLPIIPAYGIFSPLVRSFLIGISDNTSTIDELNANLAGSLFVSGLVLAMFGWQSVCRVTRASVLSLRQQEFVEASRALGASTGRIVLRHLLPNAAGPILVAATFAVADFIIGLSILSYFDVRSLYSDSGTGSGSLANGTGAQPSLGTVIAIANFVGNLYGLEFNPFVSVRLYMVLLPSLLIVLLTLSLNYIGDALRYALDPQRMQ